MRPVRLHEHSHAAAVLVTAYAVVRLVHNGVYLVAAGDDKRLRSVVLSMLMVFGVVLVLLVVGAAAGPHARVWWWLTGVVVDQVGVYFVRSTRWRLNSASHFAERFGNIILIAIGESLVGLGSAVTVKNISVTQAYLLLCGLTVSVTLWWTYFDIVARVAEQTLTRARDLERARIAQDSYTYLHLPIVAGIESISLGLGLVIHGKHTQFGVAFLYGGAALYLACLSLLRRRNTGVFNMPRLVLAGGFVVLGVLMHVYRHLTVSTGAAWILTFAAVLLAGLVTLETCMYRDARRDIRHHQDRAAVAAPDAEPAVASPRAEDPVG